MDSQIIQDFLLKQLPVIVVLGLLCFFMYKYFTGVIDSMNERLIKKDEEIKDLNEKMSKLIIDNGEIMKDLKELILKMLLK